MDGPDMDRRATTPACLPKECQPAGGDAGPGIPSRQCGAQEMVVQCRNGETALGTLNTGEPHQARSAPIAESLPVTVISTPSVSAGLWPVTRSYTTLIADPVISNASATSDVAPRDVAAPNTPDLGISEQFRLSFHYFRQQTAVLIRR